MTLIRTIGPGLLCGLLCAALAPVAWAETPAAQPPSNEIFAQQVQPSVGSMQDPHAVTPQSLNAMTIHIQMTQPSAMAMHHAMKMHPKMNCMIEPFEPGATFTMVLVCR